jgi:hypothetical protein
MRVWNGGLLLPSDRLGAPTLHRSILHQPINDSPPFGAHGFSLMEDSLEGSVVRGSAAIPIVSLPIGNISRKVAVLVILAALETVLTAQGFTPLHSSRQPRLMADWKSGMQREVDSAE